MCADRARSACARPSLVCRFALSGRWSDVLVKATTFQQAASLRREILDITPTALIECSALRRFACIQASQEGTRLKSGTAPQR